jgi:hypothetical protein
MSDNMQGVPVSHDERSSHLPRPFIPAHPEWERLYWRAWEIGAQSVRHGTPANGFAPIYADAAFSDNIFQWDTCFMAAFARYSDELLPILPALDNFYHRQESDGYIAREYRGINGANLWAKASGDSCNPPLFAWAEWLLYQIHGRRKRLRAVWPLLERYDHWLEANRKLPNGLYWITAMGCGMDNTPRFAAAWTDYSMQQALNALCMARIAMVLNDHLSAQRYQNKHRTLSRLINQLMWDEAAGIYWDLDAHNLATESLTIAPFWALIAEIAPPERAARLVAHLQDTTSFWRSHPFPSTAASHALYTSSGDYWRGAVWPPTNYMIITGLRNAGYDTLATEATRRHLDAMCTVLDETGTIWENYQPDDMAPGIPARPDFVGWSGLGPIALLIEQILGIELNAAERVIRWRIQEPHAHGIENLPFMGTRVNLWTDGKGIIEVQTSQPFDLVLTGTHMKRIAVPAGGCQISV